MFEVYITKSGKYLPNNPISNDEMENYLGLINDLTSKARRIILRNNKIVIINAVSTSIGNIIFIKSKRG